MIVLPNIRLYEILADLCARHAAWVRTERDRALSGRGRHPELDEREALVVALVERMSALGADIRRNGLHARSVPMSALVADCLALEAVYPVPASGRSEMPQGIAHAGSCSPERARTRFGSRGLAS